MKKNIPIFLTFVLLLALASILIYNKQALKKPAKKVELFAIGNFTKTKSCIRPPSFLNRLHITQPVMIDLSQKIYKGLALHYGKNLGKIYHPKEWEKFEHFGTYSLDREGNLFLIPTPYISIHPTTFNLQKNIYKLDSITGEITIFMHFENIYPSPNNPYGLNAISYDCDDHTLWVATIDKSTYKSQKGIIYHIDIATKKILNTIEGVDVLSMQILKNDTGKYLLVGSARDNALYAYRVKKAKLISPLQKLLTLPSANGRIRKIKIKNKNILELQTIPFSYTLISQTAQKDRMHYYYKWYDKTKTWKQE